MRRDRNVMTWPKELMSARSPTISDRMGSSSEESVLERLELRSGSGSWLEPRWMDEVWVREHVFEIDLRLL